MTGLAAIGTRSLRAAGGLAVLVAVWWAAVVVFRIPEFLLPLPQALGSKIAFLGEHASLGRHVATTVGEILFGFVLGAVTGVGAGLLFVHLPRLERLATPLVIMVQTAPKIALAPLLLLWLGLGPAPKIVLVAGVTFFPVMAGAATGFRYLDAAYADLGRVLQLSRAQMVRRIQIPFALPPIMAGLRIASVQAVTAAVIGELMGANRGLGYLLAMGQENSDAGIVISVVAILSLVGWVFHESLSLLEQWCLGWHHSRREAR